MTAQIKDDPLDLSPRAIARRLDEMRALSDLGTYLLKLQPLAKAAEAARKPGAK